MEKFMSGNIAIKLSKTKKKKTHPNATGTSTSRYPPSLVRSSGGDLLGNIIPSSRNRKSPKGDSSVQKAASPEPACTSIQQPTAFVNHKDPSVQSSYMLSIFPRNEVDHWGGNNKSPDKFCMRYFAAFSSGLASLLHEAIEGEAHSSVEHHKLKKAFDAETFRSELFQTVLNATKSEIASHAEQIKSLEFTQTSQAARHQKEVNALRADLELRKLLRNRLLGKRLARASSPPRPELSFSMSSDTSYSPYILIS